MAQSVDLEALVVGAGVVGLAVGRALAASLGNIAVVERHPHAGMETSSRNSEVIHAGIYYAPGSLKAQLCREGSKVLYSYCAERNIPHARCGKLIVGSGPNSTEGLEKILEQARANNVSSLRFISKSAALEMEPQLNCDLALHSPDTGIIDSHSLMQSFAADIADAGGVVALGNRVTKIELGASCHKIWLAGENSPLHVRRIVNSAGLGAWDLARLMGGLDEKHVPERFFARGVYFRLAGGQQPFRRLVYPLPDNASLGIHATIDLAGDVRFGPDVEWITDPADYSVSADREVAFRQSIANYFPAIASHGLVPDYAGIRPKLVGPGATAADFRIDGREIHGIPGLVNLFGIESPGLTASLAIARRTAAALGLQDTDSL